LSIETYGARCREFLAQYGFQSEPDPRGPTFDGGILVDLGEGVRVAFFMPHRDLDEAVDSLRGHLENIYPSGYQLGEVWRDLSADVTYVHIDVAEMSLPIPERGAA
jgi:hypothetical protein